MNNVLIIFNYARITIGVKKALSDKPDINEIRKKVAHFFNSKFDDFDSLKSEDFENVRKMKRMVRNRLVAPVLFLFREDIAKALSSEGKDKPKKLKNHFYSIAKGILEQDLMTA